MGLLPQECHFRIPLRRQKRGAERRRIQERRLLMELKVSFDGISITAYIKQSRLFEVKFLIENHVAISVQTAMTDMFKAVTINEGKVILKLDYDKQKGRSFNARPFRMEFNPNKLRQIDN